MSEADEGKSYKAQKDYINHDVDLYKTQGVYDIKVDMYGGYSLPKVQAC